MHSTVEHEEERIREKQKERNQETKQPSNQETKKPSNQETKKTIRSKILLPLPLLWSSLTAHAAHRGLGCTKASESHVRVRTELAKGWPARGLLNHNMRSYSLLLARVR